MKNAIAYYYNLYSSDIHQKQGVYRFTVQNQYYRLTPCDAMTIEQTYQLSLQLINRGIYVHQIIPNISKQLYTTINGISYVLLMLKNEMDSTIELQDILQFNHLTTNIEFDGLKNSKWNLLWSNKIDYFEYQVNQFGKRYPIIRESFGYYVGLAETGISLFVNTSLNDYNLVVSHKRIKVNSTTYDLYNPLNLTIDYKARDAAEYFKDLYLQKQDIFEDIINYFNYNYLSTYDCFIFFIRMFYPSFYFDAYEEVLSGKMEEEKLKEIIKKTNHYESLLKKIYFYLSNYMNLPDIEWIKK